jgi:predicted transcriptional regulator
MTSSSKANAKAGRKSLTLVLTFLMASQAILIIFSIAPTVQADSNIPSNIGEWPVSGTVSYNGGSADVTGNITVIAGGKLTLQNLNLTMDGTGIDSLTIRVEQGGNLIVHNSVIKAQDSFRTYLFVFEDGSAGLISRSTVMNIGSPYSMSGLTVIGSATVSISSTSISQSFNGIMADGSRPTVDASSISGLGSFGNGVIAINKARPVVTNTSITSFTHGTGVYLDGSDAELTGDSISSCNYGVWMSNSQAVITGTSLKSNILDGLYSDHSAPNLVSSDILSNQGNGINAKVSSMVLDRTSIRDNKGNGLILSESTILLKDSMVVTNTGKDIVLQGTTQTKNSKVTLYNTTHGTLDFIDPNPGTTLEAYWYVSLTAMYQSDGKAVQGAKILLSDISGALRFQSQTDNKGELDATPILSYSIDHIGKTSMTPHHLTVEKGQEKQHIDLDLSSESKVLSLTFDDIKPWIVLDPMVKVTNQASFMVSGYVAPDTTEVLLNGVPASLDQTAHRFTGATPLTPGTDSILVEAIDHVGNVNNVTVQVIMDNVAPDLEITSPAANGETTIYTNIGYITVQGRTEPSAALWVNDHPVTQSTNGRFEQTVYLTTGNNVITVNAQDQAGNIAIRSISVFYDPVAPVLQVTEPKEPTTTTNQRNLVVSGNVNDPDARVVVTLNGVDSKVTLNGLELKITLTLIEGTNQLSVKATDKAGNTDVETRAIFLDSIAPQLVVDTPEDDLLTAAPSVLVSGMTDEGSLLTINGAGAGMDGLNFNAVVQLVEGKNVIVVVARDEAGNARTVRVSVTRDTTRPTISILSPTDGLVTRSSDVVVDGYLSEPAGLILNGHAVIVDPKSREFQVTVALEEGRNVLSFEARDRAGNLGTVTMVVHRDSMVTLDLVYFQRLSKDTYLVSGRTDPDATLTINGVAYAVEPSGFFSVRTDIKDGSKANVEVKDPMGNANQIQKTLPGSPAGVVRFDWGPFMMSLSFLSVVVVVGVVGGTERGKLFALFFLFVPLYSRMKKNTVLDHYVRGQIHGYIVANPGDHYNSIKEALKLNNGTLAYHLRVLEREGIVKSRSDGIYKRFYPSDMKVPENDGTRLTEIQKIIIKRIKETPGISQKEMSRLVGVSPSTINYHIDILKSAGLVRSERRGMRIGYFLEDMETIKKNREQSGPMRRPPVFTEEQKFQKDLEHHDFSVHEEGTQAAAPGPVKRVVKKAVKVQTIEYRPRWEEDEDGES